MCDSQSTINPQDVIEELEDMKEHLEKGTTAFNSWETKFVRDSHAKMHTVAFSNTWINRVHIVYRDFCKR